MSFHISLKTFEQVKTFVALAVQQPFDIRVGNDRQNINGKDLMGIFSLDFSKPVRVQIDCSAAEGAAFRQNALALQN